MALLSQLTYYPTMLLPPLFENVVRAHVSGEFSRAVEESARTGTPETGWAAVGEL
jgi:hypothetical protein